MDFIEELTRAKNIYYDNYSTKQQEAALQDTKLNMKTDLPIILEKVDDILHLDESNKLHLEDFYTE